MVDNLSDDIERANTAMENARARNPHLLMAGQQLWIVPMHSRETPAYFKITKIGRQWATLEHNRGRVNLQTFELDEGSQTGLNARVWLTKEAWEADMRRRDAWYNLYQIVRQNVPNHVTEHAIKTVIALFTTPK